MLPSAQVVTHPGPAEALARGRWPVGRWQAGVVEAVELIDRSGGEFLSYLAAEPVYDLYGLDDTGLSSQSWPPTTDKGFRGPAMSYHLRSGGHGLDDADWDTYLGGTLFKR